MFDELPYLVASSPTLPSVLQNFIDREAKQAGLVVALTGSAQHMMQGLALSADAPLYGRAVEILPVAPLSIGCIGAGLRLRDPVARLAAFAVWGGGPRFGPAARFWRPGLPEWDVVAESLDRQTLLVGEAKWHGDGASPEALRRAIDALPRKGDPPIPGWSHKKVIRALFVPKVSRRLASQPWPVRILDGQTVLAAFS